MSFWISGTGAVSCLGLGKENLFNAVLKNQSGINSQGLGPLSPEDQLSLQKSLGSLSTERSNTGTPLQMSLGAAREALREAGWEALTDQDGLILATTTGQIPLWDRALSRYFQKEVSDQDFKNLFKHYPLGTLLDDFSIHINSVLAEKTAPAFLGPRQLITTACSASTQAMAIACMWLETGKAQRVLVGGVEVLCDLTVEGFRSLKLLSEDKCRPFDEKRNGINLSEGAGFVCLEKKKNRSSIEVCGYGMASDSHHMTAPHPEGEGSLRAMTAALKKSGLEPEDIDWIHAHGTGSVHNDLSESFAIHRLFETKAKPFVSSTKWHHGHALGASGLLEAVISVEGLKKNIMIATQGLEQVDPLIPLEIPRVHLEKDIKYVLKNTLGFGGANACFILGKGL
jgi:3-oxoacyl-(acyl-carrier-protein) synthase